MTSYICIKVWVLKLKIQIFQTFKRDNLSKFIEPQPNSNLNCLFLRCIYMSNLSWMCTAIGEIMNGNWKFSYYFQSERAIALPNIIKPWPSSNLTCAFLCKSICQIWVEYVTCWEDNEQKLKISYYFQSESGITLPNIKIANRMF
jgi:hypothetical protein